MKLSGLFLVVWLALPLAAAAQSAPQMPPPSQDMEVEEPDAPDDAIPEGPTPAKPAKPAAPAKAAPNTPVKPDKPITKNAPEVTMEAGFNVAVLRILNKVTARSQEVSAPIGSVVRSGTIEIIAHTCWQSAADERPENAALLEISEIKQGEAPTRIFLGWMYSSTPAISALEHPFYDVTVVKCTKEKAE